MASPTSMTVIMCMIWLLMDTAVMLAVPETGWAMMNRFSDAVQRFAKNTTAGRQLEIKHIFGTHCRWSGLFAWLVSVLFKLKASLEGAGAVGD